MAENVSTSSVLDQFRHHEKALAQMGVYRENLEIADAELLDLLKELCHIRKRNRRNEPGAEQRETATEWFSMLTVQECRALRKSESRNTGPVVAMLIISPILLLIGYELGHWF